MAKDLNKVYEVRAKKFLIIFPIFLFILLYLLPRYLWRDDFCWDKGQKIAGKEWRKSINTQKQFISVANLETLRCVEKFRYLIP